MKTVALTDEQAAWLKGHLDSISANRHWQEGERIDSDEHVDAIRAKLEREIAKEKW